MNFGFKLQSSGRSESFETHLTEKKKNTFKRCLYNLQGMRWYAWLVNIIDKIHVCEEIILRMASGQILGSEMEYRPKYFHKKKILVRRDPPKRTFGDPEHAIPIIVILYRLITKFNQ